MEYYEKDFGKILKKNAQELRHDLLGQGTNCMRVYDRNLEQFPVTVELYGQWARVVDYGEPPMTEEQSELCCDICSRMLYLEKSHVVFRSRLKREGREQHEKTGNEAVQVEVTEDNLHFKVDLATYVDTGLFLDQALTRKLIRESSKGADVLNLFSYTGSFSVYAASGLAASVTSVDLSATYTKWCEENLALNGYAGKNYPCIAQDATVFIADAVKSGKKYDIIIFDPPSFSNSRKMNGTFDVSRDWADWIKRLARILKRKGFIMFSTNLGSFNLDRRRIRGIKAKEITGEVAAPGFVKGRKGTARSWIMAIEDDSLKLDWSEPEEVMTDANVDDAGIEKEEETVEESTDNTPEEEVVVEKKPYEERERKSFRDHDRDRKPYGERRDREGGERRSFGGERRDRDGGYRKPYGDREGRSYSDRDGYRKPYGDREGGERRSFGDRDGGYRKPYGDREGGERRSFGDRDGGYRKPYGDREGGERRSFGDRDGGYRKPYGDREGGERRSFGDRDGGYRKPYGDREGGERRSFGDRDGGYRKPYGDREGGERRSFGDRDGYRKPYGDREGGERRSFGDRDGYRKPYGDREGGERRSFEHSDRKPFGDRGDRKPFGHRGDRKPYGERKSFGDKKKPYGFDSFKPARSRDDNPDLFWLDKDDSKKED